MQHLIPIWFTLPIQFSFIQVQNQSFECFNANSPTVSHCLPSFQSEKWQKYLQIFRYYLRKKTNIFTKKLWKKQEDEELIRMSHEGFDWAHISQNIEQTNQKICKRRYERLSQSFAKWPAELDAMLKNLVQTQNLNWIDIHKIVYSRESFNFPRHTIKELKERYLLSLRPGIVNQQWTIEEDIELLTIIKHKGTHWRKLSETMNGRTQLQLKNRYYGTLKPLEKKVLRKLNLSFKKQ